MADPRIALCAIARNISLERAPARQHLVLDADEWRSGGGAFLQGLREVPADFVGAVQIVDPGHDTKGAVVRSRHETALCVDEVRPA